MSHPLMTLLLTPGKIPHRLVAHARVGGKQSKANTEIEKYDKRFELITHVHLDARWII